MLNFFIIHLYNKFIIMTPQEVKLQLKLTALNIIRKIYHPLTKNHFSHYEEDGSYVEQRDEMVEEICKNLEKDLENHKQKYNKEEKNV